jgi:hypothetical protein
MPFSRLLVAAIAVCACVLTACADAPTVSPGASDPEPTPIGSNSDTTGPTSACPNGFDEQGVIDYAAPSKGAKQTQEEALASYNEWSKDEVYSMTPQGWAVATDDAGNVTRVITFEELTDGYWVVGGTIGCK